MTTLITAAKETKVRCDRARFTGRKESIASKSDRNVGTSSAVFSTITCN